LKKIYDQQLVYKLRLIILAKKAVWYDAKRLLLLSAPQSTVDTVGASPQRKVAYLGGTDRQKIIKNRGIFNENRN
jgi:hypothetical protein